MRIRSSDWTKPLFGCSALLPPCTPLYPLPQPIRNPPNLSEVIRGTATAITRPSSVTYVLTHTLSGIIQQSTHIHPSIPPQSLNPPIHSSTHPLKQEAPAQTKARAGAKWGVGVRHTLFPVPTFGAIPRHGCRLPDAILHGKRSIRPRSRAVQHLADTGLSSEASQLASTGGCATGLQTRLRHACDLPVRVLTTCAGSATAFDSALAQCHGSDLLTLRLPFAHRPAVPLQDRRLLEDAACRAA
jgi:hypothetical protein